MSIPSSGRCDANPGGADIQTIGRTGASRSRRAHPPEPSPVRERGRQPDKPKPAVAAKAQTLAHEIGGDRRLVNARRSGVCAAPERHRRAVRRSGGGHAVLLKKKLIATTNLNPTRDGPSFDR
jgi:hypothetical protein